MDFFEPTTDAFRLLFSGDADLWRIIFTSLGCSLVALVLISPAAIALGFFIAKVTFPGRRPLVVLIQALLSFPTVVVGLVIYMLLSRQGPLGFLKLLFTPEAIIIGYMMIALPVLVVFTLSAVQGADPRIYETARSLGAGRWHASLTTLFEVRFGVMAAVFNGFGRVVSEVGCSILVGGNIAGLTRTMPTAIALETSKGEFAQGIALGFVLIAAAIAINAALAWLQGRGGLE
ncbi:MAG: cysT [Betaproteobacteria bacterium]|nr:cysT [Betaproteobacteria bacterium]